MIFLDARQIYETARMPDVIERLRGMFTQQVEVPPRQAVKLPGGDGDAQMLLMPAFAPGLSVVKIVTICPDNRARGEPTVQGLLVCLSDTGAPIAVMEAAPVTRLRTAAASALASSCLSRPDSAELLVIGTGALSPYMALAHSCVRPLTKISIWGRDPFRAAQAALQADRLLDGAVHVTVANVLEQAAKTADIISCATSAAKPILCGRWLRPGTYVDLVGSFTPANREADDEVLANARIFVDTIEGALAEAGDILLPMSRGAIGRDSICGELKGIVRNLHPPCREDERVVFKSVGTAAEDLATASLLLDSMVQKGQIKHQQS